MTDFGISKEYVQFCVFFFPHPCSLFHIQKNDLSFNSSERPMTMILKSEKNRSTRKIRTTRTNLMTLNHPIEVPFKQTIGKLLPFKQTIGRLRVKPHLKSRTILAEVLREDDWLKQLHQLLPWKHIIIIINILTIDI